MPTDSSWIEPEVFLRHRGVIVYHTYKDDDVSRGRLDYHFTLHVRCGSGGVCACPDNPDVPAPREHECVMFFDARDLPAWVDPGDAPPAFERRAARRAIIAAIEAGLLTPKGAKHLCS